MAVATGGVIAAAVVIITAGAEAEAITMAGGTITTGKRHYCPEIGVGDRPLIWTAKHIRELEDQLSS
jgi:hypothetical protein